MKYRLGKMKLVGIESIRYQIIATKDIPSIGVKVDDVGGWVESSANLSQEGNCWIFPKGRVVGNARVEGHATLVDGLICENAKITNSVLVDGGSIIGGNFQASGYVMILDGAVCDIDEHVTGWKVITGKNCFNYSEAEV